MLHGPTPLDSTLRLTKFESGNAALDDWLRNHALQAHRSGSTRVFVAHDDDGVVLGFYALSTGSVAPKQAPRRVRKGLGAYPIPVALIARLGVSQHAQGTGLGAALLKDALLRIDHAAESLGVRAALAHAKDERARSFYEHFGFEPSQAHALWMFLLMKDLRASMKR